MKPASPSSRVAIPGARREGVEASVAIFARRYTACGIPGARAATCRKRACRSRLWLGTLWLPLFPPCTWKQSRALRLKGAARACSCCSASPSKLKGAATC